LLQFVISISEFVQTEDLRLNGHASSAAHYGMQQTFGKDTEEALVTDFDQLLRQAK
jgi:hypothetical protein